MPTKGTCYRWDEVPGRTLGYLRFGDNGHIVTAALQPKRNPDAPYVILVEKGPRRVRWAKALGQQSLPISVYLKRGTHQWEYCGKFAFENFSENLEEIQKHDKRSRRNTNIVRVIHLREVLS